MPVLNVEFLITKFYCFFFFLAFSIKIQTSEVQLQKLQTQKLVEEFCFGEYLKWRDFYTVTRPVSEKVQQESSGTEHGPRRTLSFFQFKGCFSRFLQINYTIDLKINLLMTNLKRNFVTSYLWDKEITVLTTLLSQLLTYLKKFACF